MKGKLEYTSPLDPELIEAWVNKGNDPEKCVARWVKEGAPLGIERPIPTCGIFPEAHDDDINHVGEFELLDAEAQLARGDLHNYISVTSDVANAKVELQRYGQEGYLKEVTKDMVKREMGNGTISRLGLIAGYRRRGPTPSLLRRCVVGAARHPGFAKLHPCHDPDNDGRHWIQSFPEERGGINTGAVDWCSVQLALRRVVGHSPQEVHRHSLGDHSWMARDGEHQRTQDDMWQTIVVVGRLAQTSLGGGSLLQGATPEAGRHQVRC